MLNPFNVLLDAALQRFLKSDTDDMTPTARRFRYLLALTGLYLVATVVIAGSLSFLAYRGYKFAEATKPHVLDRRGQLKPPGPVVITPENLDLKVLPSVKDAADLPTEGKSLALIADVQGRLHFRVFNADGQVIIDTDETQLPSQAERIASLKASLAASSTNPQAPPIDSQAVLRTVAAIVGNAPPPPPSLTPEQLRAQSHKDAFTQIATETGFTVMMIEQLFKSPEELAKLDFIRDLSEQFDLDVEGKRYLLTLLSSLNERLLMANMSWGTHQYLMGKAKAFETRIANDVERGGPFADEKLHQQWVQLVALTGGPTIPTLDTATIRQAVTFGKPIRRLDIVKLIVLLRATNQAIRDIEPAHRPLKDFIAALPNDLRVSTFTEAATTEHQRIRQGFEQGVGSYDPSGSVAAARRSAMQSEIADQLRRYANNPTVVYNLMRGVGDEYGTMSRLPNDIVDPGVVARDMAAGKYGDASTVRAEASATTGDPELARLWAYTRYGIYAPFALNRLGVEKVIAEQEAAAQHLESFLGIPVTNPPATVRKDIEGVLKAVLDQLPLRAAVGGVGTLPHLKQTQQRIQELEGSWVRVLRDAITNQVGGDQAVLRFEGLSGSWILEGDKLVPGEGALPVTITDDVVLRLLGTPPDDIEGFLGKEYRVLNFGRVLPGEWVLILENSGVLGFPKVVGLERLEHRWPAAQEDQNGVIRDAGMMILEPDPSTSGPRSKQYDDKRAAMSRLERLSAMGFEVLRFQWQRRWGRPFELPGFEGQWHFDARGVLVKPDPLVINDKQLTGLIFGPYDIGELAPLPGLKGLWEVQKERLILKR